MSNLAEPPSATEQHRDAANLDARVALHARFSTNARGWPSTVSST